LQRAGGGGAGIFDYEEKVAYFPLFPAPSFLTGRHAIYFLIIPTVRQYTLWALTVSLDKQQIK
jgi:hypothetical protein